MRNHVYALIKKIHLSDNELLDVDPDVGVDFLLFDGDIVEKHFSFMTSVGRGRVRDFHLEAQNQSQLTHVTTKSRLDRVGGHMRVQYLASLKWDRGRGGKKRLEMGHR